jgi:hypothetical protein
LSPAHERRLLALWRSAGWPSHDKLEIDLLAAGLLTRHWDTGGRLTLRVSDSGVQLLAAKHQRHQAALSAHESLVGRVARLMQHDGRVVWRGLSLRAPLQTSAAEAITTWATAMPDVFSIRHTTVEAYTEPVVHEIKVSRADFRGDLKKPNKGAAYLALSSQCWYVLQRGITSGEEALDLLPAAYGLMWADARGFEVARPAPKRAQRLPFAVWMALARASCEPSLPDQPEQAELGDVMPDIRGTNAASGS